MTATEIFISCLVSFALGVCGGIVGSIVYYAKRGKKPTVTLGVK